MIKLIKKVFNWYYKQFEAAYGPIISAGVNPWIWIQEALWKWRANYVIFAKWLYYVVNLLEEVGLIKPISFFFKAIKITLSWYKSKSIHKDIF